MAKSNASLAQNIFQGGLASCMAVTVSNPLEVVKIRLQLQGELERRGHFVKHYNGVGHGLYTIARQEGAPQCRRRRAAQHAMLTGATAKTRTGCPSQAFARCKRASSRRTGTRSS